MQRNPHSYQIATGYRTFYSLSLIYQPIKKKRLFLFKEAIKYIKEIHPEPCLMELNVNRNNKALQFYQHMGMRKLREGDFPIGNGYYMNDYIMGLDI